MAPDAATGTVVLFGGDTQSRGVGHPSDGTWTWNGTAWTKQDPATSPPARDWAFMAYDAATGTVVLFGGEHVFGVPLSGTWTWIGSTWTKQDPAHHPPPMFADLGSSMAYDTATGTVVLFGGHLSGDHTTNATWTWDGTDWIKQSPATSLPSREQEVMAPDPANGTVVLHGGFNPMKEAFRDDTWTWG